MAATIKQWVAAIRNHQGRLALAITGQLLYNAFNAVVDFMLCPALVLWLGLINGGLAYLAIALVIDLTTMIAYDRIKKDFLGLELVKELRGFIGRKLLRSQQKIAELPMAAKMAIVLLISWRLNPFQVVVFMRHANEYRSGMTREEHWIFWVSYVWGNLLWILLMGGIVEIGKSFA